MNLRNLNSLSLALFIKKLSDGDYKPVASKWNMKTGKTTSMNYEGHPNIKRKRVSLSASLSNEIYVEAYWYHDLMSICTLDGNLKLNLYGKNWNDKTSNKNGYFDNVDFCGETIVASYLGQTRLSEKGNKLKVNYPTKLILFNTKGDYISTLDIGIPIIKLCCDEKRQRVIFTFDNKMQFGYLNISKYIQ